MNGILPCQAVVIGGSAGGREALIEILAGLPDTFPAAIAVVMHLHPHSEGSEVAELLNKQSRLPVCEAAEKKPFCSGKVYLAPANYHLLLELDGRFSLDIDPKVNYSRPSIDVLFQSAAEVFRERLVGVLLSGASSDGALGLARIKELGGCTLAQDPDCSSSPLMPRSAIRMGVVDRILHPIEIATALTALTTSADV